MQPTNINEKYDKYIKTSKTASIIASIVMVVLGILILSFRVFMGAAIVWLAVAGFLAFGISQIVRYSKTDPDERNGFSLTMGILTVIFSLFLILQGFNAFGTLSLTLVVSYGLGFYALFSGITQLFSIGRVKRAGGRIGWLIATGIMNVILSFFFLTNPIMSIFAFEWVLAIYLIVIGIMLFAQSMTGKAVMERYEKEAQSYMEEDDYSEDTIHHEEGLKHV